MCRTGGRPRAIAPGRGQPHRWRRGALASRVPVYGRGLRRTRRGPNGGPRAPVAGRDLNDDTLEWRQSPRALARGAGPWTGMTATPSCTPSPRARGGTAAARVHPCAVQPAHRGTTAGQRLAAAAVRPAHLRRRLEPALSALACRGKVRPAPGSVRAPCAGSRAGRPRSPRLGPPGGAGRPRPLRPPPAWASFGALSPFLSVLPAAHWGAAVRRDHRARIGEGILSFRQLTAANFSV